MENDKNKKKEEVKEEKKHLKDTFRGLLPDEILDREKVPLKNDQLRQTPEAYKAKVFDLFYNQIFKK